MKSSLHSQSPTVTQVTPTVPTEIIEKRAQLLENNNKRALELLLRIQAQYETNTVSTITPKRGIA